LPRVGLGRKLELVRRAGGVVALELAQAAVEMLRPVGLDVRFRVGDLLGIEPRRGYELPVGAHHVLRKAVRYAELEVRLGIVRILLQRELGHFYRLFVVAVLVVEHGARCLNALARVHGEEGDGDNRQNHCSLCHLPAASFRIE
jgi:hypothetical protein